MQQWLTTVNGDRVNVSQARNVVVREIDRSVLDLPAVHQLVVHLANDASVPVEVATFSDLTTCAQALDAFLQLGWCPVLSGDWVPNRSQPRSAFNTERISECTVDESEGGWRVVVRLEDEHELRTVAEGHPDKAAALEQVRCLTSEWENATDRWVDPDFTRPVWNANPL